MADAEAVEELSKIPARLIWTYLCRHNHIDTIMEWIGVMYAQQPAQHPFQQQPITMEMIDDCSVILPIVNKSLVLDQLAL